MAFLRNKFFRHYAAGLSAVFLGAWLTAETASMLPLAMGAAAALMCTGTVVRHLWSVRR